MLWFKPEMMMMMHDDHDDDDICGYISAASTRVLSRISRQGV